MAKSSFKENVAPKKGDYVIFKEIPKVLKGNITPEYAYHVQDTRKGESLILEDHDLKQWISNEVLRICPPAEIKWRTNYANFK